jgi:hypothetical protein
MQMNMCKWTYACEQTGLSSMVDIWAVCTQEDKARRSTQAWPYYMNIVTINIWIYNSIWWWKEIDKKTKKWREWGKAVFIYTCAYVFITYYYAINVDFKVWMIFAFSEYSQWYIVLFVSIVLLRLKSNIGYFHFLWKNYQ